MIKSSIIRLGIIAGALTGAMAASAEEAVGLTMTFSRTGTDAESVSVATAGVDGATATLTSVSPATLAEFGQTAICANVNANTSPTIVYEFSIAGLPADFSFNTVGLTTHAYNASGGNQQTNDNKQRKYNVSIAAAGTDIASLTDIDIATEASVKNWQATATAPVTTPEGTLALTITVTKGSVNEGCFFGLEGVSLTTETVTEPVEPVEPIEPGNSKIYTISWQTSGQQYMAQSNTGGVVVDSYATNKMIFWEFIPTDNENCYYIRNTASGQYIGSCNMNPSAASKITMSQTPVEYYVGRTAGTGNLINGCYWLSSTDCENHSNESNNARALNKDGASENVITWTNGTDKVGSYWTLTESEDLYEPQPFTPSAEIGKPVAFYHLINATGLSLNAKGEWEEVKETVDHRWYFVGVSNAEGGYLIVDAKSNTAMNNGAKYTVANAEGSANRYVFTDANGAALTIGETADFAITAARSDFALKNQIYKMPCGSMGNMFITSVTIGSGFRYPMATFSNNQVNYPLATKPGNKYVILSNDAATVTPGENQVEITLNAAPGADTDLILFIDWDRDGVFEYAQPLEAAKEIQTAITVPAEAKTGMTRARIRLTDNGLTGADDDVHGEILDLRLKVVDASDELIDATVAVNDPDRGTAELANETATATAKGNALFLYWRDGVRVASTSASVEAKASAQARTLTAYFSPNTELTPEESALAAIESKSGAIVAEGKTIKVIASAEVKRIMLFSLNGNMAASVSASDVLDATGVADGLYIVKAITANGTITKKIKL